MKTLERALDMADTLGSKRRPRTKLQAIERQRIALWAGFEHWDEIDEKSRDVIEDKFNRSRKKYIVNLYQVVTNDLLFLSKSLSSTSGSDICLQLAKKLIANWPKITDKEMEIENTDTAWEPEVKRSLRKATK